MHGRSRVSVIVDVDTAVAVPVDDLRDAVAERVRPELLDWSEVGDHAAPDGDGIPDTGDRAAARAVASHVPTLLACGDDVTVRRCIEAVAGASTALGIVSLGQGSLLAANIGLPPGLDALPSALEGEVRHLDVGDADGQLFGVHAGFGVDALTGRRREGEPLQIADLLRSLRGVRGWWSSVTVHVDGVQHFDGRTPCVLVANAELGAGRAVLVPGAVPDDGRLDLVVVAPRWPHQRLRSLWRLLTGRPQDERDLLRVSGEWIALQMWDRRGVELDGEPRLPTSRVDLRVWPGALAVRIPPTPFVPVEHEAELPVDALPGDEMPADEQPAAALVVDEVIDSSADAERVDAADRAGVDDVTTN